jgi:hypothetical protein
MPALVGKLQCAIFQNVASSYAGNTEGDVGLERLRHVSTKVRHRSASLRDRKMSVTSSSGGDANDANAQKQARHLRHPVEMAFFLLELDSWIPRRFFVSVLRKKSNFQWKF